MYLSNTVIRFLDLDRRSKKGHLGPFGPFLGQIWGSVLDPMYVLSRGWGSKKRSKKRSKKGPKGVIWGLRGLRGSGGSGGVWGSRSHFGPKSDQRANPLFDQKGVRFWENWASYKQGPCPEEFDPFGTPESDPKRAKKGPKRGQKGVKRVIFDQKGTIWSGPLFDQKGVRFWENWASYKQGPCPEEFDPFGTPESDPKRAKKGPKRGQKGHLGSFGVQKGTLRI